MLVSFLRATRWSTRRGSELAYFSQVLGVLSVNSSIISLPAGSSPMLTSKKTLGLWDIVYVRRASLAEERSAEIANEFQANVGHGSFRPLCERERVGRDSDDLKSRISAVSV